MLGNVEAAIARVLPSARDPDADAEGDVILLFPAAHSDRERRDAFPTQPPLTSAAPTRRLKPATARRSARRPRGRRAALGRMRSRAAAARLHGGAARRHWPPPAARVVVDIADPQLEPARRRWWPSPCGVVDDEAGGSLVRPGAVGVERRGPLRLPRHGSAAPAGRTAERRRGARRRASARPAERVQARSSSIHRTPRVTALAEAVERRARRPCPRTPAELLVTGHAAEDRGAGVRLELGGRGRRLELEVEACSTQGLERRPPARVRPRHGDG